MNIGKAIGHYRQEKRWTMKKLSGKLKKRDTYISLLEKKQITFNVVTLLEICKVFDIQLSQFITKAEEYD